MILSDLTSASPLRNPRIWLASLAIWALLAVLMHTIGGVNYLVDGRSAPFATWAVLGMLSIDFGPFVAGSVVMLHLAPQLVHRRGGNFWWHALGSVLAVSLAHRVISMLAYRDWWPDPLAALLMSSVMYSFHYAAILGVGLAHAQRQAAQLRERELLATQLRALRAQLQPHFLFNTLQAIGATAPRDGALAARMTTLLGDLLRQTLRERDGSLVSLAEEQLLLQPYLQLQQLRFSDRLRVEIDIPAELLGAAVPDLLLQPLVENALQHGIEQQPGAGTIKISARRSEGQLRLEVHDDGKGPPIAATELKLGTGLGATTARLRALFGEAATLVLQTNAHGGTTAIVQLPFTELRHAA